MARVQAYRRVYAMHSITGRHPDVLLAKRYRPMPLGTEGTLFGIDEILGDDQYIFLTIEGTPFSRSDDTYLFDAEELIKEGALLRTIDILHTQAAKELKDIAVDELKRSLISMSEEEIAEAVATNKKFAEGLNKLKNRRDELTLSGDSALAKLKYEALDCADKCELLVPRELELGRAKGVLLAIDTAEKTQGG